VIPFNPKPDLDADDATTTTSQDSDISNSVMKNIFLKAKVMKHNQNLIVQK